MGMAKTTNAGDQDRVKAKPKPKGTAKAKAKPKSGAKSPSSGKSAAKPKPAAKKPAARAKTKSKAAPAKKSAAKRPAASSKTASKPKPPVKSKPAVNKAVPGSGVPAAVAATLANAQEQLAALNDAAPSTDQALTPASASPVPVSTPAPSPSHAGSVRSAFERMPDGFWPAINTLCDRPEAVREAYRQGHGGPGSFKSFLAVILIAGAAYGATMGATNTLQGTGGLLGMVPLTAVKMPLLLLVTYAFALAPLYLASRFLGYSFSPMQASKLLLAATAVIAVTLAGSIPIAALFAITGAGFPQMQQLHAFLLLIAIFMGALFFTTRCHAIHGRHATIRPLTLIAIFSALQILIAVQWISVTGPYIGSPDAPFALLRP
jgi:hypothetical protein